MTSLKNARKALLPACALAVFGFFAATANAATITVDGGGSGFLAEAFPEGAGYQYTWSATPNLLLNFAQHNSITGRCQRNMGYGTIYVTVTYPNGHVESTQRGVACTQVR